VNDSVHRSWHVAIAIAIAIAIVRAGFGTGRKGSMNVCVVALGKIGLPLAVQFARSGHHVIGCDISAATVELVTSAVAPFPGEAHLDTYLAEVVAAGKLTATTHTSAAVANCDVVIVVVPLVVDHDKQPDFTALDQATAAIAAGLQPGALVIYETTLPVGTTRQRFAPALAAGSGLTLGESLFVAFSPERVYSGRIFADLRHYPKLVGGIDATSAKMAIGFYESALQFDERSDLARPNGVWDLGASEAAELAKLAETTYRDINIAFANELARHADQHGIDIYGVIDACNSQPFSHIHQPGIAVGGHCIPVYPHFYLAGDPSAELPAAARRVNEAMPAYAVSRLADRLGSLDGLTVAVLGLAYRGGVKESAFSGAFATAAALTAAGAHPVVHDPLYTDAELTNAGFMPYLLGQRCDAAIVQADHIEYRSLRSSDLGGATVVVDGRRCINSSTDLDVITLGAGSR
jgi:nucleotide sugar dehydrogenase